jgi:hypothetical protein
MTRSRMSSAAAIALVALAAAACQDSSEPPLSPTDLAPPTGDLRADVPDQLAIAREIPAFGGLFIAEDGVATVYLTDAEARPAVEARLEGFMRGRGEAASALRVVPARFNYLALDGWFRGVAPLHGVDGVVFSDLDEARNRVVVGVEHGAARMAAEAALGALGVPRDAIEFQVTEPIHLAATLRSYVRPLTGGLQIHFSQYVCTLGFNATHSQGSSFITNSHCTAKQGGTEGTLYYQPTSSTPDSYIGIEVDDPTYFKGGVCPRGKQCRYSDSARGLYEAGVLTTLGAISRPESSDPLVGTLNISATNPVFTITGKRNNVVVGEVVNKVGRTTGWTYGEVTRTCVNTSVSGSNIMQLCQNFVSAGVQGGDSGSNVFSLSSTGAATLVGILWGGTSANNTFVYSPIGQIEQELGALTVH